MKRDSYHQPLFFSIFFLFSSLIFIYSIVIGKSLTYNYLAKAQPHDPTQQQSTFDFLTPKPKAATPTSAPTLPPGVPTPTSAPSQCIEPAAPIEGGCWYCIDDTDPEFCDEYVDFFNQGGSTGYYVLQGQGGPTGSCDTVIHWSQQIASVLPYGDHLRSDSIGKTFTSCDYTTQTYASGYVSTYFVIDSYNLAGFHELTKAAHTSGATMNNWWKSAEAVAAGYKYTPYSAANSQTILKSGLIGSVMFLQLNSGVHVGIVNSVEVDTNGNGFISILQTGPHYWINRFAIVNWEIKNTPLHGTQLNSVLGFGGH